jgi:hypothetical protein
LVPVSLGQRAAAAAREFKDNIVSVESCPFYTLAMWKDGTCSKKPVAFSQTGSDRPDHDMGSGKFFVRLGDTLAAEMVDLREMRQKQ